MEARLGKRVTRCPVCQVDIDSNYLVCPVCTTRLKQPCARCKAPLEPLWQICPYCESPVAPQETIGRRGHLGAAAASAPLTLIGRSSHPLGL